MEFIDKEHELFWNEKNLLLQQYGKTDVYYRSLVYTLGICETTRNNFNKIFNIEKGEINIDSINGAFQTGTTVKVTRMAFSLWNRCNYDSEKDLKNGKVSENYNPSDIFCCSYAPYFVEAIKIRYPEYFRERQNNRVIKLTKSDDRENVEKYAIYIRSDCKNEFTAQAEVQEKKEFLLELCEKNNYNVTHIYIDEGFSGRIDDKRIAFNKMLDEVANGKINGVISQNIEQLVRDEFGKAKIILDNVRNSGSKIIIVKDGKLQDIMKINEQKTDKILTDIKKMSKQLNCKDKKKKNKIKER